MDTSTKEWTRRSLCVSRAKTLASVVCLTVTGHSQRTVRALKMRAVLRATIYSAIIREIAVKGDKARFRKVERGRFTLAR